MYFDPDIGCAKGAKTPVNLEKKTKQDTSWFQTRDLIKGGSSTGGGK